MITHRNGAKVTFSFVCRSISLGRGDIYDVDTTHWRDLSIIYQGNCFDVSQQEMADSWLEKEGFGKGGARGRRKVGTAHYLLN